MKNLDNVIGEDLFVRITVGVVAGKMTCYISTMESWCDELEWAFRERKK